MSQIAIRDRNYQQLQPYARVAGLALSYQNLRLLADAVADYFRDERARRRLERAVEDAVERRDRRVRRVEDAPMEVEPVSEPTPEPTGAPKSIVGAKRSLSKMRTSIVGKRFRRPKYKRDARVRYIRGKYEISTVAQAFECAYVGHTALPLQVVLKYLGLAFIELYTRDAGIAMPRIDLPVQRYPSGTTDSTTLTFWYNYQRTDGRTTDSTATTRVTTSSVTGQTWEGFAIQIMNHILSNFNSSSSIRNQTKMYMFGFHDAATDNNQYPARQYNVDEMYIELVGKSILMMQNRTDSTTGSASTDVVDANPIRGKHYSTRGSDFTFKDNFLGLAATSADRNIPRFIMSPQTGTVTAADRRWNGVSLVSDFTPDMIQYVRKPPSAKIFKGAVRERFVRMLPGQIRKNVVRAKVKKSLNGWLNWLITFNSAASVANYTGDVNTDYYRVPFTNSDLFAFEEMCDTSTNTEENTVTIGCEWILNVGSRGYIKKHRYVYPVTDYKFTPT